MNPKRKGSCTSKRKFLLNSKRESTPRRSIPARMATERSFGPRLSRGPQDDSAGARVRCGRVLLLRRTLCRAGLRRANFVVILAAQQIRNATRRLQPGSPTRSGRTKRASDPGPLFATPPPLPDRERRDATNAKVADPGRGFGEAGYNDPAKRENTSGTARRGGPLHFPRSGHVCAAMATLGECGTRVGFS